MKTVRIILSLTAAVFGALMFYATMTVPAISATAPAILTIAAFAVAWLLWPKHRKAQA